MRRQKAASPLFACFSWGQAPTFNTPLEMHRRRGAGGVVCSRCALSILHWRCLPLCELTDQELLAVTLSILHWRCPLMMRLAAILVAWPFNTPLEMLVTQCNYCGGKVVFFQYSIGDAPRWRLESAAIRKPAFNTPLEMHAQWRAVRRQARQ